MRTLAHVVLAAALAWCLGYRTGRLDTAVFGAPRIARR